MYWEWKRKKPWKQVVQSVKPVAMNLELGHREKEGTVCNTDSGEVSGIKQARERGRILISDAKE